MSATPDRNYGPITERETPHGYWWRYSHREGSPDDTLTAAIMIAGDVAATEASQRGKTYLVARAASGADAIYVFACDHPDACNAAINVMFEFTPAGKRIRRPGPRTAARHRWAAPHRQNDWPLSLQRPCKLHTLLREISGRSFSSASS